MRHLDSSISYFSGFAQSRRLTAPRVKTHDPEVGMFTCGARRALLYRGERQRDFMSRRILDLHSISVITSELVATEVTQGSHDRSLQTNMHLTFLDNRIRHCKRRLEPSPYDRRVSKSLCTLLHHHSLVLGSMTPGKLAPFSLDYTLYPSLRSPVESAISERWCPSFMWRCNPSLSFGHRCSLPSFRSHL